MKPATSSIFTLLLGVTIGISTLMGIGPGSSLQTYAQTENETESSEQMEMNNTTVATGPGGTIPSMSTPGEKTFYLFTAEVEDVDEEKLKIAGDSFDLKTLVANKRYGNGQILQC